MISFIIDIVYNFVSLIVNLFPTGSGFPEVWHTSAQTLGGYFNMMSVIIPVEALSVCIGLLITVELSLFGFKTVKWLISHIPFVGGRG